MRKQSSSQSLREWQKKSRYNRELFSTTTFDVTQEFHVRQANLAIDVVETELTLTIAVFTD